MPPQVQTPSDRQIMAELIRLAERQLGNTSLNPVVGAAVVKDGRVISRGVHRRRGGPHAEVEAIQRVIDQCNGASLLVTLEPCTHFGKTPPCVDLIVRAGIRRVVYAVDDPNSVVRARPARQILEAAGIEVVSGVCADQAQASNRFYFKNRVAERPYVSLKAATSLDGRIALANGESKYITSEKSRKRVHQLRRQHEAILVGVGTVAVDDPSLSIRLGRREQFKTVIVLDPQLRLSPKARLFEGRSKQQVIVVTAVAPSEEWQNRAMIVQLPGRQFNIDTVLERCFELEIGSILVEGGSRVFTDFITEGRVDMAHFFIAPVLMMGAGSVPVANLSRDYTALTQIPRLSTPKFYRHGVDIEIVGPIQIN